MRYCKDKLRSRWTDLRANQFILSVEPESLDENDQ